MVGYHPEGNLEASFVALPFSGWNKTARPFVMDLGSISTEAATISISDKYQTLKNLYIKRLQDSNDSDKTKKRIENNEKENVIKNTKIQRNVKRADPGKITIFLKNRKKNNILEIIRQLKRDVNKKQLLFNVLLQRRKALPSKML